MRHMLGVTLLVFGLGSTALPAQTPKPGEDALAKLLFDPQLVLKFARELSLQTGQRATIVSAIKQAQGDILDLQLQMAERHGDLIKAVEAQPVDEKAAMALAESVLELEQEMKKKQLLLLIRIKTALTQEQQSRLRELRRTMEELERGGQSQEPLEDVLQRPAPQAERP
jgi:Spy/CpxP family protein refolding chaperone